MPPPPPNIFSFLKSQFTLLREIVFEELVLKKSCLQRPRASPSGKRTIFNHYVQRIVYKYHLESVSVEGAVASSVPECRMAPQSEKTITLEDCSNTGPTIRYPDRKKLGGVFQSWEALSILKNTSEIRKRCPSSPFWAP